MSRYIDYDAIDYKHYQLHDKSEEFLNGVIYMAQRIEEAPSIDIVRCKECKWARPTATSEDIYCEPYKHYRYADGFCSYGEVRDE